jgi:signal transduction histidine kinase
MVDSGIGRLGRLLRGSVRVRTTSVAVAVVGVSLLIGSVVLVVSMNAVLVREVHAAAVVRATEAARVVESGGDPVPAVAGDDDVVLQVLGPSGEVLSATPNVAGRPALVRLAPGGSRELGVPFEDDPFLFVAVAAGNGRTVLVGHALDAVAGTTGILTTLLALGLPALVLVVGATAWRVVGRALASVDAIRVEADAITGTQLHRRIPRPSVHDEIGRLADTMNRMLDRLERARSRERRFVADASHELRSPITVIRQHAEVALTHPEALSTEQLARAAHAESVRMQALVDDLLLLAQADEQTLSLRRRPTDLDDLVLEEARRVRTAAVRPDSDRLVVDASNVSAARIDGDPAALGRLLHNLGDNAARHARQQVAFTLLGRDGCAELHVDDDGPGVSAADRSRVFERFVRLDEARARTGGGSGLGLAIVAEIVAAHGGAAIIQDSPLGGTRVTVRIPLAAG